jgi:hypothetical protein
VGDCTKDGKINTAKNGPWPDGDRCDDVMVVVVVVVMMMMMTMTNNSKVMLKKKEEEEVNDVGIVVQMESN